MLTSKETSILNKLYFISGCIFLFAFLIIFKLINIQYIDGDYFRKLAEKRAIKDVIIPSNRGNIYSLGGELLAASVTRYDIRIDPVSPSDANFQMYANDLCDSVSKFNKSSSAKLLSRLRSAREDNNQYFLLANDLGYSDYLRFKSFPLLKFGAFKGGLIVEENTKRNYPLGPVARRSIGYEKVIESGNRIRVGIDGAFGDKFLRGIDGKRLKQSIGKGQWKPIDDFNKVEPQDGYDIHTTIDVNIQDITHHALMKQLEFYNAHHGSAVVMETKTGEIRAISNLGKNSKGEYYERLNYAIQESYEPGSTFKLMALAVALDDSKIDTTTVVDTKNGVVSYYGKKVKDSREGGYGKISIAEAFEISSNTAIVSTIHRIYKNNPTEFIDGLYKMNLRDSLGLNIIGEGKSLIPDPRIKSSLWSGISLEWMSFGYGVQFTPLQTLTFYNAIANNGKMVKPRFLRKVKSIDKTIETFETEVINNQICKPETVKKLQALLKNVIEKPHGTGHNLYSDKFSMAGKTGTCQKDYVDKEKLNYISSFSGYFPSENPKYSCIVVIHEPDKDIGYYGADVAGPVFKKIAHKILTDLSVEENVADIEMVSKDVEVDHKKYYKIIESDELTMPNLIGMAGMDAISILENMNMNVQIIGSGLVCKQSIKVGTKLKQKFKIVLELS